MSERIEQIEITELMRAPIKSCAPEYPDELVFDANGRYSDREYMWVEDAPYTWPIYEKGKEVPPGTFLSQRNDPEMVAITPVLEDDGLTISVSGDDEIFIPELIRRSEGLAKVSVWSWSGRAADQGQAAADWGSEFFGRPVRLVKALTGGMNSRHVNGDIEQGEVGFADGYPVLLLNEASIDAVNQWLVDNDREPIDGDSFRGNIRVKGLEPFEEDLGRTATFREGGEYWPINFVIDKACGRCPIPDIDQYSGDKKRDVRKALKELGRVGFQISPRTGDVNPGTFFGQNCLVVPGVGMGQHPADRIRLSLGEVGTMRLQEESNWSIEKPETSE